MSTTPPVTDAGTTTDLGMSTDRGTTPTDSGTPTDNGTPTDGGRPIDGGKGTDGGTPTDSGTPTDGGPIDAGPPVDPCAAGSVVDLNAMGTRVGATTRITRSNATAPRIGTLTIPAGCSIGSTTAGQMVFRYSPTATGRLVISTDNAATTATFDTVVWAQTTCAPLAAGDSGVGVIGCDDDGGETPRGLSSRLTTAMNVTAGTPIFIVVAGFGGASSSTGTFELSVSEIMTVAVGAACDTAGLSSVCATGSLCVGATSTATMGTCLGDGALNGRCRSTGTACDGALVCSGTATITSSRCRTAAAAGAACDPDRVMNVCATGSNCVTRAGASTCVALGTVGGTCRATEPRCDGALSCSSASVCRTIVAVGGACESSNATTVCATGGSCVPATAGAAMGTCRAAGSGPGTACRTTEPRCDGALSCSGSVCRTIVAAGGACETGSGTTVCAGGGSCLATTPGAAVGTCRAAGSAAGTDCRDAEPRCDTGFSCSSPDLEDDGLCVRTVAAAAACVVGFPGDRCTMGTACLPTSATAGTCSATATPETEPNSTPATAQAAITSARIYSGTTSSTDVDCFNVTVPAGGSVFAESNRADSVACLPLEAGSSPDPVIDLYNAAGVEIADQDDTFGRGYCGTLNPATDSEARGLAAGTYTVCIRGYNTTMFSYLLTITSFAAP